jgi:hypothetical protein
MFEETISDAKMSNDAFQEPTVLMSATVCNGRAVAPSVITAV